VKIAVRTDPVLLPPWVFGNGQMG